MADATIQVEITALDKMSSVLKKIESNTSGAMTNLKDTFSKAQGAMLNLGQAAMNVKNLFDIQENATRNLENAMDRLQNADLRLKQANKDLENSYRKLNDITQSHERDSLNLERAQLRLEDAQKTASFAVKFYGENSREAKEALLDLKEAQFDLTDAQRQAEAITVELADAQQEIKDKQDSVTISTNNVEKAQRGLTKVVNDNKWAFLQMGLQGLAAAGNIGSFISVLSTLPAVQGAVAAGMALISAAGLPVWAVLLGIIAAVTAAVIVWKNWDKIINTLKVTLSVMFEVLKSVWDYLKKVVDNIGKVSSSALKTSSKKGSKASGGPIASTGMYQLHAGEYVVPKRNAGGGTVVNINGPIYGVNSRQISEALYDRFRNSMTI